MLNFQSYLFFFKGKPTSKASLQAPILSLVLQYRKTEVQLDGSTLD